MAPHYPDHLIKTYQTSAANYEHNSGGSTRSVARQLIPLLPKFAPNAIIHDNAAGTGVFTSELLAADHPSDITIHATDLVPGMIQAKDRQAWQDIVHEAVMDSQNLGFSDAMFDLSVVNFSIAFLPDPVKGASEIYRTLKPGGTAIVSVWTAVGVLDVLFEAQTIVRPKKLLTGTPMEIWAEEGMLENTMKQASFTELEFVKLEGRFERENIEALHQSLLYMAARLTHGTFDEEEIVKFDGAIKTILKEKRVNIIEGEGGRVALRMEASVAIARK